MTRLYEQNYRRLERLMGRPLSELRSGVAYRLRAEGYMDLAVEVLPKEPAAGAMVLSLPHYFVQHGDFCQDPEMTVRVFPPGPGRPGLVEALTFRQAIPPVYQAVYPEPGKVAPRVKRELNACLATWLRNLRQQGHRSVAEGG
jgi:uncharacterized protein YqiB (DUF1249 family)